MTRFKGRLSSVAVPLAIGMGLLATGGCGLLLCLTATSRFPSPLHAGVVMLICLFVTFCGWTFVQIAQKGFVRVVELDESGLILHKFGGPRTLVWEQINRLVVTGTGLNMRLTSGEEVELGPGLENFDELSRLVKERYNQAKGIRPLPPSVGVS